MPEAGSKVIRRVAAEKKAAVFSVVERFGQSLENYPKTNLFGTFQRWNAGTAITTCALLDEKFPRILDTAESALQLVDWPGRWQRLPLPCGRTLILDATHNPEGSYFLDENLEILEKELGQKPWIVAGTLGEFRAKFLIPVAAKHARGLYLVEPRQPRSATFDVLRSFLPKGSVFPVLNSTKEELFPGKDTCAIGEPGDTVVVTGSIYLLGEVLERLTGEEAQTGAALQDLP